ncbi:MAG: hypothetical protein VX911_03105, partial [Candidatus Latescibacterota bacterium]|nr:hypothetical protein [Candidatus Latescibacterota bacterium]
MKVEVVLANDYLVEVSSNRQTVGENMVFLRVTSAPGNVKDSSNQRVVSFDYDLPTANQIMGLTVEVSDMYGFKGYAEVDVNRQYRQYPNLSRDTHHTSSDRADVWLVNVSRSSYPWFAFGEAFRAEPNYSSSLSLLDRDGEPKYDQSFWQYEFVEDNDDQDQFPDWSLRGSSEPDREIFPGWDENNDFISDFNQNDNEESPNLVPDYEEPFLRFHVNRPGLLYGLDMNHNQWVDGFENDDEPDYPYQRDRKGYNVYGGFFIAPDVRLNLGRQRLRQISKDRRNWADYLLLTVDVEDAVYGRLRLFQDLRKVRDTISDDLFQWVQEKNTRGSQRLVTDVLPAQDAWVNTTWLGCDLTHVAGLYVGTKLKWQFYRQLGSDDEVELRRARRQSRFFGLVNKAEYAFNLSQLSVIPHWKSEFRSEVPVGLDQSRRTEVTELFLLMLHRHVMRQSFLEGGVDYEWFRQLRDPTPPGAEDDFRGLVLS